MSKMPTVQDFFRRFPTDDACLDHLMAVRYGNRVECPKCHKTGRFARIKKIPAYSCAWCGHHIHPMEGTPFERSRTSLQKWFYAMYLFTTTRHGVPAKELQRQLGVTYKTAWRIGHEIRKYMAAVDGDGGLSGHVEVDEAYIGGKKRDGTKGRGASGKTAILGMVERGGHVILRVVPNAARKTLEPHIRQHIAPGTRVSSDEWSSYRFLASAGYVHKTVDHGSKEYARGDTHVNTLENLWGQLKRSIRGTHIHVSRKHLPKYLGEFEFRYNLRKAPEIIFARLLTGFAGGNA